MQKFKKFIIPASALGVIICGYLAYSMGLIPGLSSPGQETANQLKADIKALEGDGIKKHISEYVIKNYEKTSFGVSPEQKAKDIEKIKAQMANAEMKFSYAALDTKTETDKGFVILKSPAFYLKDSMTGRSYNFTVPQLEIGRDVADKNHYYYSSTGNYELESEFQGVKQKTLAVGFGKLEGESKIDDNFQVLISKMNAENMTVLDGRSGATFAKIASITQDYTNEYQPNNKMKSSLKMQYKGIEGGDMVKMMLGNIPPLDIKLDYVFSGDDPYVAAEKFISVMENKNLSPEATPAPQPVSYEANLVLNQFALMLGTAGLNTSGNLEFKKENTSAIPFGDLKIVLENYQQLLDLAQNTMRMPPEIAQKNIVFLKEIGVEDGANINFIMNLDGTENVKINNRSLDEVKAIKDKHFPPMPISQTPPPMPMYK